MTRPSDSSRRNLWKARVLEDKYSAQLRRELSQIRQRAIARLPNYLRQDENGNQFIDMQGFSAELSRIIEEAYNANTIAVSKNIETAYKKGVLSADIAAAEAEE